MTKDPDGRDRPIRVLTLGASQSRICGVRDYARILESHWDAASSCDAIWWQREPSPSAVEFLRQARGAVWRLRRSLERDPAAPVLWHYSVFTLAYRGLPIAVPLYCRALRRSKSTVVTMLHEFAYPWRQHGLRGSVWGVSQRAVLPLVVSISRGLVVTMEARARWLEGRPWLPERAVLVSPVYPTLPRVCAAGRTKAAGEDVALLGYAPSDVDIDLVLDVLARLRREGRSTRLRLIGNPGANHPIGERWRIAAERRGCRDAVSFTGVLSAEEAADAVADAALVLVALKAGPSSRKTTIANALAAGKPIIATDGPETWAALVESGALRLVSPNVDAVTTSIRDLLDDPKAREALSSRARSFAEHHLDATVEARRILDFVRSRCSDHPLEALA